MPEDLRNPGQAQQHKGGVGCYLGERKEKHPLVQQVKQEESERGEASSPAQ